MAVTGPAAVAAVKAPGVGGALCAPVTDHVSVARAHADILSAVAKATNQITVTDCSVKNENNRTAITELLGLIGFNIQTREAGRVNK